MKTLVNKTNPQIRITAPEIKVNIDTQTFYIGEEMFDMEDWTLVEEEPEKKGQTEVNLEKELNEWMKYGPHTCYPWCSIPDAIKITAEHFYKLGKEGK